MREIERLTIDPGRSAAQNGKGNALKRREKVRRRSATWQVSHLSQLTCHCGKSRPSSQIIGPDPFDPWSSVNRGGYAAHLAGRILHRWRVATMGKRTIVPCRSKNHISTLHRETTTLDGGKAALALDNEAQSKGCVSVGRGSLTRHDQLHASVESVCSLRSLCSRFQT